MSKPSNLGQLLDDVLLPKLFDNLPNHFPEFGWKWKDGNRPGWVATERNPNIPDARPDRVVCNQKGGFYVHGVGVTPWISYIAGTNSIPTGVEFVKAVKAIADLVGVDADIARDVETIRMKANAFEAFWRVARDTARKSPTLSRYLQSRGLPPDTDVGLCPEIGQLRFVLKQAGLSDDDIAAAGIGSDTRIQGRMVIPWRDVHGTIRTFTYRDLSGSDSIRYLNHKDGEKPSFFGLDTIREARSVVVVEGVLDVLQARHHGFDNVIALGGAGDLFNRERMETLSSAARHCRSVILAMDADQKGVEGLMKAVLNTRDNVTPFTVLVVDGEAYGGCKDPDELMRKGGVDAWNTAMASPSPCALWMAHHCLSGITPETPEGVKREALMALLDYDAGLSGPLSRLDNAAIDKAIAEHTGYDAADIAAIRGEYRYQHESAITEQKAKEAIESAIAEAPESGWLSAAQKALTSIQAIESRGQNESPPSVLDVDAMIDATRNIPDGVKTGWNTIDGADVAFMPGEMAVIAARTGHGKTTFLINLLWQWLKASTPDDLFLLYSLEEPETRIFQRLLALSTQGTGEGGQWAVNECRDFIRGKNRHDGWPGPPADIDAAIARLKALQSRVMVIYRPGWNADDIAIHAHKVMDGKPITGILLDYLQRLPPPEGKYQRRDQEISVSGRILKHLAVDTNATVVAAAQINRESVPSGYIADLSKVKDFNEALPAIRTSRPELHHLREGGSEQEADLVLGILNTRADYRHDVNRPVPPESTPLDIGILKNRYGATGRWLTMTILNRLGYIREQAFDEREGFPSHCKGKKL